MSASDRLIFLGSPICPYCQRVELALCHEGVEFEHDRVELGKPTAAQRKQSPFGRFPLVMEGQRTHFESGAILEWLSERRGGAYMPHQIGDRARVRGLALAIDAQHAALRAFFTASSDSELRRTHTTVTQQLTALEHTSGPWLSVGEPHPRPLLSAFYLTPLVLLCGVLDSTDFPLLDSMPGLVQSHERLVSEHRAFQLLDTRRPEIASFFLGFQSTLTSLIGPQLKALARNAPDAEAIALSAGRYMQGKSAACDGPERR